MSEWKWIDRREREPDCHEKVLILFCDGDQEMMTPEMACRWPWSHWIPIPPPPPRTVAIEISEDDAEFFTEFQWDVGTRSERIAVACRAALAKLEGK